MLPKRGAGGIFDVARANGKGAGHMGLGLPEAAVREKGAGRRGRGQEKVQVCLLERRADGIWVLRRGSRRRADPGDQWGCACCHQPASWTPGTWGVLFGVQW